MKKSKIESEFIKAWKPLFELYPELIKVPVYAWGRYYKYECAGSPFCTGDDVWNLESMAKDCNEYNSSLFTKKELTLLEKIDNIENIEGGKLFELEIGDFSPSREDIVKAYDFDDRGGMCLIIVKNSENNFSITTADCDSPE